MECNIRGLLKDGDRVSEPAVGLLGGKNDEMGFFKSQGRGSRHRTASARALEGSRRTSVGVHRRRHSLGPLWARRRILHLHGVSSSSNPTGNGVGRPVGAAISS